MTGTDPDARPGRGAPAITAAAGPSGLGRRLRGLTRSALVRSVALLASGTLVAQAIGIVVTPALSRVYTPAEFGVLGLVNGLAMLFFGVAALRYDMAIVLPKSDEAAVPVVHLSLLAVLGVTSALVVVLVFAADPVSTSMGQPGLAAWLWWSPPIVLATGVFSTFNHWCTRQKKYRRLTVANVVASIASASAKLGGGFAGLGALGLVGGQLGGQLVAATALSAQVARDDLALLRHGSWAAIRAAAREHVDFPRYHAPTSILSSVSQGLPVYLLGAFFSAAEVGHWAMCLVILRMPTILVGNAMRQVLYQRASEMVHAGGGLSRMLLRSTGMLAALAAAPAVLVSVAAPWFFPLVLGPEWTTAGHFARYLISWQALTIVAVPATAVFPVLGMQRAVLIWQVGTIALSALGLALGGASGDAVTAVACFSIVQAVAVVLLIAMVVRGAREAGAEPPPADVAPSDPP